MPVLLEMNTSLPCEPSHHVNSIICITATESLPNIAVKTPEQLAGKQGRRGVLPSANPHPGQMAGMPGADRETLPPGTLAGRWREVLGEGHTGLACRTRTCRTAGEQTGQGLPGGASARGSMILRHL
jgi:hypothetical protein